MGQLHFRLAHVDDAAAIALLARRVVRRWIVAEQPPEGVRALEETLSTPAIRERLRAGQRIHLAFVDGVLAGLAAVRDDSHVSQFLVGTRYQGQGIGRRLWSRLRRDCMRRAGTQVFTLNASRVAMPFYQRLGFVRDDDPQRKPGKVVATPMIYWVDGCPWSRVSHDSRHPCATARRGA